MCICVFWGACVASFVGPSPSSLLCQVLPSSLLHWSWGLGGPPRPLPILGIGLRTMQGDRNNSFFEPGQGHSSPNIGTKPVRGSYLGGGWIGEGVGLSPGAQGDKGLGVCRNTSSPSPRAVTRNLEDSEAQWGSSQAREGWGAVGGGREGDGEQETERAEKESHRPH